MANTALIVVDFQREFVGHQSDIIDKISKLAKNWPVQDTYWMIYQNTPDSLFVRHLGYDECIVSPESSLIRCRDIEQTNTIIHYGYTIDHNIVRSWNGKYKDIILVGADIDACLLATAYTLWDNKIRPVILTDYCISSDGQEYADAAIKIMLRQFGKKCVLSGYYSAADFLK